MFHVSPPGEGLIVLELHDLDEGHVLHPVTQWLLFVVVGL